MPSKTSLPSTFKPETLTGDLGSVAAKIRAGREPIARDEAALLYRMAPDELLADLATTVRDRWHPRQQASYIMMSIVNYTNVCVAKCDYCAFYRLPHQSGAYLLSFAEVCAKIDALRDLGGRLIGFNGGFHPKLRIDDYADLFARLHERYKDSLAFYEMTVAEFMFACKTSRLSYDEGARRLRAAGTQWVTGGGAEILDDGFRRRHSPGKYTVDDYFKAQSAIVEAGIGSTATMVIGFDESLDERLNHLERLRQFQTLTGESLTSFLCWTYKPYNTQLGGAEVDGREYQRWLAICRLYLHNFRHIRTSVLTRNEEALAGLCYGANDFDLPTEDEVTQKAGALISQDFEAVLAAARRHGYEPVRREPFVPRRARSVIGAENPSLAPQLSPRVEHVSRW